MYSPAIQELLGSGDRLIPLVASGGASVRIDPAIFADCRYPAGALAGAYTYFSDFENAHKIAQDDHSLEGSYWHGILHRQEPDAFNAGYWFRRVPRHPIFADLAAAAAEIVTKYPSCGFRASEKWDPQAFIEFCETARRKPGSDAEQAALEIQLAEWQLLFGYCAGPKGQNI
ncbi:hypothetical protein F183_A31740 [Bryobacterales bacterium F-183]|nr:hypothetical protein F183_A31740 [Bryobacterales bacterium F-183]